MSECQCKPHCRCGGSLSTCGLSFGCCLDNEGGCSIPYIERIDSMGITVQELIDTLEKIASEYGDNVPVVISGQSWQQDATKVLIDDADSVRDDGFVFVVHIHNG